MPYRMESISSVNARDIIVSRQFPSVTKGLKGLNDVISRLGYVQIDTISVVERSHHHILWSRFSSYSHSMIDKLQRSERKIFEYWSHAASYLPMHDYSYSLPRKLRYRSKYSAWRASNKKIIRNVLDRIRAEGPLSSRDFEGSKTGPSGWWNHKPAKAALDFLFHTGELMVSFREGFSKYYDFPENILPDGISIKVPDAKSESKHLILSAINAGGIVTDKDILYLRRISQNDYKKALTELSEEGMITAVKIENKADTYRTFPEFLSKMSKTKDRVRILSPFDNLIINRSRLKRIFGYQYTLECYVPENKRKFGYFCLPVLKGTEFIGMIECKADRIARIFRLIKAYPYGISMDELLHSIAKEIPKLAEFSGCKDIEIDPEIATRKARHS